MLFRSSGSAGTGVAGSREAAPSDVNHQDRKDAFLKGGGKQEEDHLAKEMKAPASPYMVQAGTVIPVVLLTGINSDLPGTVVGQVRENVYDTVRGQHLLIPQGSRVLAKYDSMVAWGQDRVLLCWNRLIRPDGTSINLECMPGVDLAGYSGIADQVDNHWWRIITGVGLSSLLAATTQSAAGNVQGNFPTMPQMFLGAAGRDINQFGQELARKNLNMQPTITVRPGFAVNVLVSKDMVLEPYVP